MRDRLRITGLSVLLTAVSLTGFARRGAAQEADSASEGSSAVYSASAAFDLRPRVERASFHLRHLELQSLYSAIAEAYGIRLIYDKDITSVRPTSDFELENVTLKQALEAAGNISRTFVAPLDEHTGIVANDSADKRAEYERQVLASFTVDNQTSAQQMTEISTALRSLLDLRRVAQDTHTNWISVLGRAHQVDVARRFIETLEQQRGEVMVDMDILEVDSQRARELGILPPQPYQLVLLGIAGSQNIPLNLLRTGSALFGVQLPGASLPLTFNSSAVRSQQNIQVRASDGQEATLLIGDRVPILNGFVTNSFFTGAAANGTSATSQGFFPSIQYQDVGVSVKATPYMHSGREMTLKFDLALRALGSESLNGAPVIANRQVTEQVRLREGETYLIGGILSHSVDSSTNGYPLLSRLPFIGGLFGTHTKRQSESELLVLVRPHVIRRSPAELFASNSIYFGKELQGLPAAPALPAEQQPAQPVPGQPGQPGVQPQPGVPVPGVPTQPGVVLPGQPFPPGVIPGVPNQPGQPPQLFPGQPPGFQPQPGQTQPPTYFPGVQPPFQQPQPQPAPQQQQQQ